MGISPVQLLIILFIVVLIFGGRRLRNLGSDLGEAIKGFRTATKTQDDARENAHPERVVHHDDADVIEGKVKQTDEPKV